ncbi:hypothetical protein F0344_12560 [Streptomyces finlayi]|uniref:Uncharacterized protein n=1 Tax=Streptomyces finlayi TaxID=67296 RepID=A0A7G7BJ23_9ACTN|nr:hypothetical protein [Streptomyces finlayi]QNE75338.1 hypothetical protein F0344_12560 [Streptomyces finlayi]
MALNLIDIPVQAGGWFKPADVQGSAAFLVEVHSFERQRPTANGPKDSALCDVTVFRTPDQLEAGTPEITKGVRIEQTILARDLQAVVGGATIVTLDQIPPSKPGQRPAWVWRQLSDAQARNKVIAYANEREAKAEAAVDDAPDFD